MRNLDWDGLYNVRDLGGLGAVRRAAVVRAEEPVRLSPAGWQALRDYGVRTIIDLRGVDEAAYAVPDGVRRVQLPLDDYSDTEFWTAWGGGLDCTPLYYPAFLERYPHTVAGVLRAVADAEPGGVLIHCAGGKDRTGLIVLLLLALAGVPAEDIAADYALSAVRLRPLFASVGIRDQVPVVDELCARHGITVRASIESTVDGLDVDTYLRAAGMSDAELAALRARLLAQ